MSLSDLKRKCVKYSLHPCSGAGITKEALKEKIDRYEREKQEELEEEDTKTDYEKMIEENDPDLYSIIRPYVPLLPDIRPSETMKKMKKEEQNNWRIIYEELSALGNYPEHVEVIDAINSGDTKKVDPLYTDERRELIEEVIFSYPGLIWLMLHVSPEKTILPIIVSQGRDLPDYFFFYLEKIPVNSFSVNYLRDKETASIFYSRNPTHFTYETLIKGIQNDSMGFVYFVLQDPNLDINDNGMKALKEATWSDKNAPILEILLKDPRFIPYDDLFVDANMRGKNNIVKVLLKDGRIDPGHIDSFEPGWGFNPVLRDNNIELFRILMEDGRIDPTPNGYQILNDAIYENNIEVVRIIIEDGRINVDKPSRNDYIIHSIMWGKPEILELLLSDSRAQPSKNENEAIIEAIRREDIESLSILLNDPRIIIDENVLKEARETGDKEIIDIVNKAFLEYQRAYE